MTERLTKKQMYDRILAEYPGYHPVIAMVRLAHQTANEAMRFACHAEIAKYVEPKLASVAHTHEIRAGTGVLLVDGPKTEDEWAEAAKLSSETVQRQALLIEGESEVVG